MRPRGRRGVPTPALDAWRAELARGERARKLSDQSWGKERNLR